MAYKFSLCREWAYSHDSMDLYFMVNSPELKELINEDGLIDIYGNGTWFWKIDYNLKAVYVFNQDKVMTCAIRFIRDMSKRKPYYGIKMAPVRNGSIEYDKESIHFFIYPATTFYWCTWMKEKKLSDAEKKEYHIQHESGFFTFSDMMFNFYRYYRVKWLGTKVAFTPDRDTSNLVKFKNCKAYLFIGNRWVHLSCIHQHYGVDSFSQREDKLYTFMLENESNVSEDQWRKFWGEMGFGYKELFSFEFNDPDPDGDLIKPYEYSYEYRKDQFVTIFRCNYREMKHMWEE